MKRKTIFLFIFALILSPSIIWSQDALHRDFQKNRRILGEYSSGSLTTYEYQRVDVEDIALYDDYVEFSDEQTGERKRMSLKDISILNVRLRSRALEGLGLGALCGALLPLTIRDNDALLLPGEVFLISTAVGAGIGLLIGSFYDKNKTVYQTGTFFTDPKNGSTAAVPRLGPRPTNLIHFVISIN